MSNKKTKTVIVDIEVEHDNEYTTEEENEESDIHGHSSGKLGQSEGSGSNLGSSRNISIHSKRKDKDHMASFNKKMSSKLKERMLKSGGVKSFIIKQPTLVTKEKDEFKKSLKKSQSSLNDDKNQ
jgi:hypothetical protein